MVEDDGLQKPVLLDVVGKGGEVILVEQGQERGSRVGFYNGLLGLVNGGGDAAGMSGQAEGDGRP
ncbi:hypothetical protein BIV24_15345 [Streptomyces colonosanans]|uniref:Uncharacterized protein n=1 Tax=Streptomyces colonosanans TaxID=1428652 RepID=A0A1S2PF84_9ACTN|nr:hypothetical protein BIV24_15345 [Streptomyces colonosanans]